MTSHNNMYVMMTLCCKIFGRLLSTSPIHQNIFPAKISGRTVDRNNVAFSQCHVNVTINHMGPCLTHDRLQCVIGNRKTVDIKN